jgi:uncharacterized protein YabE (DUF348 family)
MNLKISQFPIVRARLVVLALATLFVLIMASAFVRDAFAQSAEPVAGQHVITLHDSGEEVGFLTDKHTLREALADAKIAIGENDLTEPGLDEELTAATYEVNIYRARPVNVIDGENQVKVMTPYRTAKQIAKQAGIAMRAEDTATLSKVDDVLAEGAVEQLVIDRATAVTLEFYGKTTTVYTQAGTLRELLTEKNLSLGDTDKVSPSLDTVIAAGMKIGIWREGKQTVTREEIIEMPIREVQDSDKDLGYKEVKTKGKDGTRDITYEIIVKNGKEVSRKKISSITTKEAVEQVVVVGTKVNLPAGSHEDWMAAAGIAESDYGYVNYIVNREGGWEPCKVYGGSINCNAAAGGPYGMLQANPGTKMASAGSDWRTNPITQLRWGTRWNKPSL